MPSSHRVQEIFQVLLASLFIGLFCIFLELVESSRTQHWTGWSGADWLGVARALSIYVLTALLLMTGLFLVTARLLSERWHLFVPATCTILLFSFLPLLTADSSRLLPDFASWISFPIAGAFIGLWLFVSKTKSVSTTAFLVASVAIMLCSAHVYRFLHELYSVRAGMDELSQYRFLTFGRSLGVSLTWLAFGIIFGLLLTRRHYARLGSGKRVAVFFALGIVSLPVGLSLWPSAKALGRPDGPSLLLITADTMRADVSSVYGGNAETPNLEALAQNAVVFDRAYSLAPWTLPSLCAMMSSQYPPGLDVDAPDGSEGSRWTILATGGDYWLPPDQPQFYEMLRENDVRMGAFCGNFGMLGQYWLWKQFDVRTLSGSGGLERRGPLEHSPLLQDLVVRVFPSIVEERPADSTRVLTRLAESFLKHHRDKPFFLWVHYFDPHTPYDPPQEFRIEGEDTAYLSLPNAVEPDRRDFAKRLYESEVRYVDDGVGRIIGALDRYGLGESTYVCFTSDHGEELWDRLMHMHGYSLFEEQIHVPLLISGPGIEPRRTDVPTSAIDLIPSFASMLGVEPSSSWRGRSLFERIQHDEPFAGTPSPVFVQSNLTSEGKGSSPLQAIVTPEFKLIRRLGTERSSLYNLENDPGEKTNVRGVNRGLTRDLSSQLNHWTESFQSTLFEFEQRFGHLRDQSLDAEQEEVLRGMGYLN